MLIYYNIIFVYITTNQLGFHTHHDVHSRRDIIIQSARETVSLVVIPHTEISLYMTDIFTTFQTLGISSVHIFLVWSLLLALSRFPFSFFDHHSVAGLQQPWELTINAVHGRVCCSRPSPIGFRPRPYVQCTPLLGSRLCIIYIIYTYAIYIVLYNSCRSIVYRIG